MQKPVRYFFWSVFFCLVSSAAVAETRLVLSSFEESPLCRIAAAVLKEAYAGLGIQAETYYTSGQRSLALSSSGHVDGELVRVAAVGARYPSLLRIPVPILELKGLVFVRNTERARLEASDLPKLRVGYLGGVVQSEEFTKGFERLWIGHSETELFKLLAAGRLDAVVSDSIDGQMAINQLGLTGIEPLGDPFQVEPMFHYLHERHSQLVPQISGALERMHRNGDLATISRMVKASLVAENDGLAAQNPDPVPSR